MMYSKGIILGYVAVCKESGRVCFARCDALFIGTKYLFKKYPQEKWDIHEVLLGDTTDEVV